MGFKRVSAGTEDERPLYTNARWINSVTEAAEYYQQNIRLGGGAKSAGGNATPVKVRNKTGGDLVRGSVVQIGAELLNNLDPRYLWFEGDSYTDGALAVLTEPIKDEKIGRVKVSGDAIARINVTSTSHKWAAPASGETVLQSADSGPVQILSTLSATGEQECAVLIGGGGSGGAASADYRVRVYDNLAGASADSSGEIAIPTVRGLREYRTEDDGWNVDTDDDYLILEPAYGVTVDLSSAGGCGSSSPIVSGGVSILLPIMGENRVTDDNDDAVVIRFTGVARSNTVTVTISGVGASDLVQSGLYVGADGVGSSAAFDVSVFSKCVLKVKVQVFEPGGASQPARYAALPYTKGDTGADLARHNNGLPLAPDLLASSDTGASDTDNYTDDTTPTFETYPNVPHEASGPAPWLYANGDLVYQGSTTDWNTAPFNATVSSAMSVGVYDFQLVCVFIEAGPTYYWGPASRMTRVEIVADASAGAGSADADYYCRRGMAGIRDGVLTLLGWDGCPQPMSTAEQTKYLAG